MTTLTRYFAKDLFENQTVFITGGSSGINLGIARNFAAVGAKLAIVGRSQEKLDAATAELRALGARVSAHSADVRDYAALETAKRSAVLNTQQSFLGVVNGLAQVRALDAALISSTSALESNKLGYEVGVRINIDVLNAEQQVYVTKRDLSKARFDTLLAQLKLKAAVGSLGEADLEQINPLFEAP